MNNSAKYPDKNSIRDLLESKHLDFKIMEHKPLLTIPPALEYFEKNKPDLKGDYIYCKNLFLKNKSGGLYLITAGHSTKIDYKKLCKLFKTKNGNIREAEKEKMENNLHVESGHVNPFSMLNLNEEQRKEVQFYLDKNLEKYNYIGCPPMEPTSTAWIKVLDLINLLEDNKIKVNILDLNIQLKQEEEENKEKQEKKKKENNQEEINNLGMIYKKDLNFSEWYSEIILKSEMIDYYDISGCYILRPWAYEIWERIQNYFDNLIKKLDVKNAYFPLFVSQKSLFKEKEHVEGFSPEVAWVTKSGKSEIDPPIAIRPTSETIMYPSFAKWIRSHRDLPLKINQWTNIVRWEFKNPTPFIRTREFLWQEGHTAHSTFEEAEDMVYKILKYYKLVYEDLLACPVIEGKKTDNEKFAGGYYTTSIETMLDNGKGVQCATSHHLGQNFSKMFDITFLDKNKNKQYVYQTSWGLTTRTIGVLVMMHGDNNGLVLPPKVSPIQVVIIPIKTSKDDHKIIQDKGEEIFQLLKNNNIRVYFDDNDMHTPGWKYAHWELKGVPIRIEYGKKDLMNNQVTFFCRDNKMKFTVKFNEVLDNVINYLDIIQKRMFDKVKDNMNKRRSDINNFNEFLIGLNKGNLVYTKWCNDSKCEDEVKERVKKIAAESKEEDTVGTCKTLNIPLEQPNIEEGSVCFACGKPAKVLAIWGRSY